MSEPPLSRRERQILDVLYGAGEATAQEVRAALPDAPSYSAVRALLRIMEEKGQVTHREEGVRYVYMPATPRQNAAKGAMRSLVQTFFGGNPARAALTLLSESETRLSLDDIERLSHLIEEAKRQDGGEL